MKIGFIAFMCLLVSAFAQAEILVIANPSVTETTLTRQDVKNIFMGKKKYWKDKTKINFATLSTGQANTDFVSTYLGISPRKYSSHLEREVFTQPGSAPRQFKSSRKMVKYIAATEGAIGYIDAEETSPRDVAIVAVE